MPLPKKNRLTTKKDFSELYSRSRPTTSEHFSLRSSRDSSTQEYKIAVIAPTSIAPLATTRNMLRRRVSASVSRVVREHAVRAGTKVVLSLRSARLPATEELRQELLSLMNKSGILHT